MENKVILSPFFLGQPRRDLEEIAQANWMINTPDLPEGDQPTRMSAIHLSLNVYNR